MRRDEALSAFDGEHNMEVDLRVGVGHAGTMPPLTGFEIFLFGFYKDFTPTALMNTGLCFASRSFNFPHFTSRLKPLHP
jgi:hypothetical protein